MPDGCSRWAEAAQRPGIEAWRDRVHSDDVARLRSALDVEHRIIDGDGLLRWLKTRDRIVERNENSSCTRGMAGDRIEEWRNS